MDKVSATELKVKAIEILIKYRTTDMLQWLMDQNLSDFVDLNVHSQKGTKDERKIDKSICFENSGNRYELFYLDGGSFYTPDGGAFQGKFCLYYNDELVIQTSYAKEYGEWETITKILWYDFNVDILKLSDYVEDIPKIAVNESRLISSKKIQLQEEKDCIEAEKINKNIDLGKYK